MNLAQLAGARQLVALGELESLPTAEIDFRMPVFRGNCESDLKPNRVLEYLGTITGEARVEEIAPKLGITESAARGNLERLREKYRVKCRRVKKGRVVTCFWSLP